MLYCIFLGGLIVGITIGFMIATLALPSCKD